jgi:hypothetical protein
MIYRLVYLTDSFSVVICCHIIFRPSTIDSHNRLADIRSIRELDKELRRQRTAEAWVSQAKSNVIA